MHSAEPELSATTTETGVWWELGGWGGVVKVMLRQARPTMETAGAGLLPQPGEAKRGPPPPTWQTLPRTPAGLSRREPPPPAAVRTRGPPGAVPVARTPPHTHTEHTDPGLVPGPPRAPAARCRGGGGAVAKVTELPARRDEWAGSARDL